MVEEEESKSFWFKNYFKGHARVKHRKYLFWQFFSFRLHLAKHFLILIWKTCQVQWGNLEANKNNWFADKELLLSSKKLNKINVKIDYLLCYFWREKNELSTRFMGDWWKFSFLWVMWNRWSLKLSGTKRLICKYTGLSDSVRRVNSLKLSRIEFCESIENEAVLGLFRNWTLSRTD